MWYNALVGSNSVRYTVRSVALHFQNIISFSTVCLLSIACHLAVPLATSDRVCVCVYMATHCYHYVHAHTEFLKGFYA